MNLADIMKQAGQMQAKLADVQEKLEHLFVQGQAGNGLVKITMTGKFAVRAVEIDPSLMQMGEHEILEDLILTALGDAKAKAEVAAAEEMKSVTAGMPLPPGMKLPF
jgi:nucleoid-associated protein EbfC